VNRRPDRDPDNANHDHGCVSAKSRRLRGPPNPANGVIVANAIGQIL